ncbi:heterokaryon incompatibility protein-domain-containing protein [Bisporella sp. PMI_857]|nr:heterokaryon incompatibility protein-domain-containing protein [Bisporella sp. PMI_857]
MTDPQEYVPTSFCVSCTATAKCLFFTIEYISGWTCKFPEPHILGTVDELLSRPQCALCSSILHQLSLDHIREDPESEDLSPQTRAKVVSIKHTLSLHSGSSASNEPCLEFILLDDISTGIIISIMKRGSAIGTAILRRLEPQMFHIQRINPSIISQWLNRCEEEHGESCQEPNDGLDAMEIDLIEVETSRLIKATTAHRYVALSYVNGRFRGFETTIDTRESLSQEGSLLQQETLSSVVRQALIFTMMIGEKYLWVDTLCIIQDDPQNKHDQIARMDEIYTRAVVTFVSLSGRGADEGLLLSLNNDSPSRNIQLMWDGMLDSKGTTLEESTPISRLLQRIKKPPSNQKVQIMYSPPPSPDFILPFTRYQTRGWTFQEHILSSRIVFFSNWQIYARCRKNLAVEHMNQLDEDIVDTNPLNQITIPSEEGNIYKFVQYCKIVRGYTLRNLSYKSDILNAFAGISRALERKMATPFRYGLPGQYFNQALFWMPTSKQIRRLLQPEERATSNSQIPSWSWAGWEGQAHYLHTFYSLAKPEEYEFRPEIIFSDDAQSTDILRLPGESIGSKSSTVEKRLDPVLRFEAWTAPGDIFTYFLEEQGEAKPSSRASGLDSTFDDAVLRCAIIVPNSEPPVESTKGKEPAFEANQATNPSDEEDLSDDEDEQTIGEAWLTYEHSPLHETVQNGEHCWVLLAKDKGFRTRDGAYVTRPENFPDEFLTESDTDSENRDTPWMAQLMLVRWDNGFAERVALAYIEAEAWDGIIAEKGEKKMIFLV